MLKFFILIIILVILLFSIVYQGDYYKYENIICYKMFDENKFIYRTKIINNIFTKNDCLEIINEGENYAKKNSWLKKRHDNYPTTDNKITNKWKVYKLINDNFNNKISKEMNKLFNLKNVKLVVKEYFIVKYDVKGQKSLQYHKDGSEFSFIIGLNDEFTGGGTHFKNKNNLIKLGIGDCVIFSGLNEHKGVAITSGTRYILTGFIHLHKIDFYKNLIEM